MKKKLLFSILIFYGTIIFAATPDESIQQAKVKYAAGNPSEAIAILENVVKENPSNLQAKRIFADICVDTGEKEYDNRNFKNAYEYFKKAVKVLPTHPIATERYWKMKSDFDVSNLKNEGGTLSVKNTAEKDNASVNKTSNRDITSENKAAYTDTAAEKNKIETEKDRIEAERKRIESERKRIEIEKKEIRRIESNPRIAEDIYEKKILNMEERFNKRLLDLNTQQKKTESKDKENEFLSEITDNSAYMITAVSLFVIAAAAVAMFLMFLIKFVRIRSKSKKGGKEYERLFADNSGQYYNELIKMQNIKELINKIKSGELDWSMIKKSISEMDRELRLEVFSYIETKVDPDRQPLTMGQADILMALVLDGDEYLRRRVSSFLSSSLSHQGLSGVKALPNMQRMIADKKTAVPLADQAEITASMDLTVDMDMVVSLSKLIDRKVFNDRHALRVGVDAYYMAGLLGLSPEECNLFYIAGLVHDVGYLDVSSQVLNKRTSLTEKEYEIIRTHTQRGIELLDFMIIHSIVNDGILFHHERFSGEGYPEGLSGKSIPLVARVIAIFDMYEALILPRPQRPAFPVKEAQKIIKKGSGKIFDPEIVKIFEKMAKENLLSREDIWK